MNTEKYNFDDVQPIPVTEDSDVVLCKIMYSEEFKTVFGYLRALMKSNELSERAVYVACRAISLVPAHYTVWQYKYRNIEHLVKQGQYQLSEELEWCSQVALENEKNYQIWHYREMIIKLMIETLYGGDRSQFDFSKEYDIVTEMLDNDEKNYHVWSYKRWIVQYFNLFHNERELEYTEKLISIDVRNNSAWSFRHFLNFGDNEKHPSASLLGREVKFTCEKIESAITNPSSWNYLKSLYGKVKNAGNTELLENIRDVVSKYTLDPSDAHALDQASVRVSVPAYELRATLCGDEARLDEQRALFTLLGETLDPVRRNYWAWRLERCQPL